MPSIPTLDLNDGRKIPILGLGCMEFAPEDHDSVRDVVYEAIKIGYRHFDTAYIYQTEGLVGEGIRKAIDEGLVKREEVFVVTKVANYNLRREDVISQAKESNAALGLGYIDLLLVHAPLPLEKPPPGQLIAFNADGTLAVAQDVDIHTETWGAMQELVKEGITKSIGVSNYSVKLLQRTLAHASIKPAVNQIESNPFHQRNDLLEFAKKEGIILTAYSPFGGAPSLKGVGGLPEDYDANQRENKPLLWDNEVIQGIAKKHGKTVSQILLKFHVARGVSVIPKTIRKERLIENASIFDFELDDEDWKQLRSLEAGRSCMPAFFVGLMAQAEAR